ncbi:MAG: ABC transporter permease [Acidimicrobiales bacterium]
MRALRSQIRAEITMTLRRGESVLVTIGIPVMLLLFFGTVHVLPTGTGRPIDFLAPGVLALAVMSTSMVSLGIATGFERSYGVLKRLGSTPLGRSRLLAAKTVAILSVEVVQVLVIAPVAIGLGWRPHGDAAVGVLAVLLATAGFAGIGLAFAGSMRAELTLAAVNGLYLVFLLLGGMVLTLSKLPHLLDGIARLLPAAALSSVLRHSLGVSQGSSLHAWLVLAAWGVLAPVVATLSFHWQPS